MSDVAKTRTPGTIHIAGKGTIKIGRDAYICTMNWRNRDANAAFVVKAWNAHDALVDALKAVQADERKFQCSSAETLALVDAALASAGEGK